MIHREVALKLCEDIWLPIDIAEYVIKYQPRAGHWCLSGKYSQDQANKKATWKVAFAYFG
ncbi:hypothetical protein ACLIKD_08400 [Azonexus sp. IMCC34842]|uniref:hypothetical protein n=1 Tax=Azonexus sp. IMCC34842 TaxID=3420950 RepID=UPI003D0CF6C5